MKNRPAKPKFKIIFDTNSLYGGEKNPLKPDVLEFINEWKNRTDVDIEYLLPEIVQKEYIKNASEVLKVLLPKISPFLGLEKNIETEAKSPMNIVKVFIEKTGFTIIPTPLTKIDIEGLLDKAIYHEPPFQKSKEKGFKDDVIAQTVFTYIKENKKKPMIVFVCGDYGLRGYMETETRKIKNFEVLRSFPDLRSFLRLLLEERDENLISEISEKANEVFYNEDDPSTSLFSKWEIAQRIKSEHNELFEKPNLAVGLLEILPPTTTVSWLPISNESFEVSTPVFKKKSSSGYYVWETTVAYSGRFEKEKLSLTLHDRTVRDYFLEFLVEWKFKITNSKGIESPKLVSISHSKTKVEDIPTGPFVAETLLEQLPTLHSGTTISGQGTVPVETFTSHDDLLSQYTANLPKRKKP